MVPEGEQYVSIMTFGSNEEKPQVCEFVKVGLTLRDGDSKQLTLLAVPMICEPLSTCDWKSISWLDQISIGISSLEEPVVGPVGLSLLTPDWDGYYLDRLHFPPKSNPHLALSLTHYELMLCHRM